MGYVINSRNLMLILDIVVKFNVYGNWKLYVVVKCVVFDVRKIMIVLMKVVIKCVG